MSRKLYKTFETCRVKIATAHSTACRRQPSYLFWVVLRGLGEQSMFCSIEIFYSTCEFVKFTCSTVKLVTTLLLTCNLSPTGTSLVVAYLTEVWETSVWAVVYYGFGADSLHLTTVLKSPQHSLFSRMVKSISFQVEWQHEGLAIEDPNSITSICCGFVVGLQLVHNKLK